MTTTVMNNISDNGIHKKPKKNNKQDLFLVNILNFNNANEVLKEMDIKADEFVSWLKDEEFMFKLESYTESLAKIVLLERLKSGNTEALKIVFNKKSMKDNDSNDDKSLTYKSILKLDNMEFEI